MKQGSVTRVVCFFMAMIWSMAACSIAAAAKAPAKPTTRMIALTFDDGPSNANTAKILDILEVNGARATFFVIGSLLAQNAETARRAQRIGCEIGNHTYDHKTWTGLTCASIITQVKQTDEVIERVLGSPCALVRAPGGHCCGQGALVGRPLILWSIDTEDWKYGANKNGNTAENREKVIRAATENVRDGDIILMHDIYAFTAQCCETIVPRLQAQGFELVTVSEMMRRRCIEMHSGDVYCSAR